MGTASMAERLLNRLKRYGAGGSIQQVANTAWMT